jgi:hypothetical protein
MRKLGPVLVVLVLLIGLGVGVAYNREPAGEARQEISMLPLELVGLPDGLMAAPDPAQAPMGGSVAGAAVPAAAGVQAKPSARIAARSSAAPVLEDAFFEALDGGSPKQAAAGAQVEQSATTQFDGRSWRTYAPGFVLAGAGMALLHASGSDIEPRNRQLAIFLPPTVSKSVALNANEAVRPVERGLGGGMVPVAAGAGRGGSLPNPAVAIGAGAVHGPPVYAPGRRAEGLPGAAAIDPSIGRTPGGTPAARGEGDENGGTPWTSDGENGHPPVRNPDVPGGSVDIAEVPAASPEAAAATVTPEPVSIALLGTGLAGVAAMRRRRKQENA